MLRPPTSTLFPYTTLFRSRSHAGYDFSLPEPVHDLLGRHTFHVKANDTSRKLVRHRSIKLNFRHLRQALFELTVKRVNSFFDRLLPNFLMKLECTIQRPAVFKRVKAARRHSSADRYGCFWANLHPHLVSCIVEGGNCCRRGFPGNRTTPYQASASRPEHPLVASATKKSQPNSGRVVPSTPRPWTPSTQNSTRSRSSRSALIGLSASAIARSGSFTPVQECTQVTASTRV